MSMSLTTECQNTWGQKRIKLEEADKGTGLENSKLSTVNTSSGQTQDDTVEPNRTITECN